MKYCLMLNNDEGWEAYDTYRLPICLSDSKVEANKIVKSFNKWIKNKVKLECFDDPCPIGHELGQQIIETQFDILDYRIDIVEIKELKEFKDSLSREYMGE